MVKLKPNNLNNVTVLQSNGIVQRSRVVHSNGRDLYSEALRSKGKAGLSTEVQQRRPVRQSFDEQSKGKATLGKVTLSKGTHCVVSQRKSTVKKSKGEVGCCNVRSGKGIATRCQVVHSNGRAQWRKSMLRQGVVRCGVVVRSLSKSLFKFRRK